MADLLDDSPGSLDDLGLQPMGSRQDFQPFRNMEVHLRDREFLQHLLQDMEYIILFQLFAVNRKHGYAVSFRHFLGQLGCLVRVGLHGIEQDHKWFP